MGRFFAKSKYVKYRDSTWIECRKRVYLYWFKFLRHAEESADHKVQWNKYRAWGGKEAVMNMKFDAWWDKHWKDCFGIDEKTGTCMYPVNGRPKADGVRYALLCYENRHRGSNWDIAIHVNKREIKKIQGFIDQKGLTIIPLKIYFNIDGIAKLQIAIARGKKLHDKRETEKQRDWNRSKQRLLKNNS